MGYELNLQVANLIRNTFFLISTTSKSTASLSLDQKLSTTSAPPQKPNIIFTYAMLNFIIEVIRA